ncbi:MAG: polysaccharide biosynthesis protein [Holosporaceae bacterium]|nr:polysaccharide biosynthesis protein [Holosporaceae bacterium]
MSLFFQKSKKAALCCCQRIFNTIRSLPDEHFAHIKNFCIIFASYVVASFFIYPTFYFHTFFKEFFSLLCTYCAIFLWFNDRINNEIPFRIAVGVTACISPVLFINNAFGVAFLSLLIIIFCEFLIFEYQRGCKLFSNLIPVYIICEDESVARCALSFFDDYKVLELIVLSNKNSYSSMRSIEDIEKWLKKISYVPFYPSPKRLLYFSKTLNEDVFIKLLDLSANFSIPLFKATNNVVSSDALSIAPVSVKDFESISTVEFDKAALSAFFKNKRIWICYDGRGSVLDLIYSISDVNSVDITIFCESEKLMFEADQELSTICQNKNYKIKVIDINLLELQPNKPDIFFYNMPIKSVNSGEENLKEAVVKNVLEIGRMISFAQYNKIPQVFVLSSSGSLNAKNWIGATQRLGELFAQFADSQHKRMFTKFRVIRIPSDVSSTYGSFGRVVSSIFANGYIESNYRNYEPNIAYYRKDIFPLLVKAIVSLMKNNDITSSIYTIAPKNSVTFDDFVKNACRVACLRKHHDVQIVQNTKPEEMELDDFIDISEPLEKTAIAGILRTKFSCNNPASYDKVWTVEEINAMTTRELISAVFQSLNEKIQQR